MNPDLPIDLLRSFVRIVEVGTVKKAAELVHRTAPAISLQMSRLEDAAGAKLFAKAGRGLVLTAAGETLLPMAIDLLARHDAARAALHEAHTVGPARLGLVQDFAAHLLSDVLQRIAKRFPGAPLSVVVGSSVELLGLADAGKLDVVLCSGGYRQSTPIASCAALWLGDKRLLGRDKLPLILVSDPCPYAKLAISALEDAGRGYEVVLRTPSLEAMLAAVAAGIGVGCRNQLAVRASVPVISPAKLPRLGQVSYRLRCGSGLGPAAKALAEETKVAIKRLKL